MRCGRRTFLLGLAILLAALPLRAAEAQPDRPLNILFIGNSYTFYNRLPTLFQAMAKSAGHAAPVVDSATPGGVSLMQHLGDPRTLAKIDEGAPGGKPWDVVILQEQSQAPALAEVSPEIREKFLKGATGLYDRIKQKHPQARVILYETWARHPSVWQKQPGPGPIGKDPAEMQARLRKWYDHAAREYIPNNAQAERKSDVTVAPAGDAWEISYAEENPIPLHADDGSHPRFAGTYLAALVIYSTVYDAPPAAVKERGDLPPAQADRLKRSAGKALAARRSKP